MIVCEGSIQILIYSIALSPHQREMGLQHHCESITTHLRLELNRQNGWKSGCKMRFELIRIGYLQSEVKEIVF